MRKTKEEAEKTKNDILDSAITVFAEKGYFNATLSDIAKNAGVTRGAIYWHFKNKVEIFDALFDRLHKPLVEMIMQDMHQDHPHPLEQIRTLTIKMLLDLEHDTKKTQALKLFVIRLDYADELAPFRDKHTVKKKENMKLFTQYFERAKQKSQLPHDSDPALLTLALGCYMKGILVEYLNTPESFDLKKNAPILINHFFDSMIKASL